MVDPLVENVLVNPAGITHPTRIMFNRINYQSAAPLGTTLRVRLLYPNAPTTPTVWPVIRVFAGDGSDLSRMSPLRNLVGDLSVVLRGEGLTDPVCSQRPTDESFYASYSVPTPSHSAHAWDCDGNSFFIIGVERALQSPNAPHLAFLQVKII